MDRFSERDSSVENRRTVRFRRAGETASSRRFPKGLRRLTFEPLECRQLLTASLGNFVWDDLNNNGVQDTGEPGHDGVTVNLYNAGGSLVDSTATAGGGYSFSNLAAGTYSVGFVAPANMSLMHRTRGGDDTKDSDPDPFTGLTPPITLADGQNDLRWDAGLVPNITVTVGSKELVADPGNPLPSNVDITFDVPSGLVDYLASYNVIVAVSPASSGLSMAAAQQAADHHPESRIPLELPAIPSSSRMTCPRAKIRSLTTPASSASPLPCRWAPRGCSTWT